MISETNIDVISVSQLNRQAKQLLESRFNNVRVQGEISNLATPSSGHWYFTLKDQGAQVRCAMFRNRNQSCKVKPQNGDKVKLRAQLSLYEARGDYQLIVQHLAPAGLGDLHEQFEALKTKLQAEGLFDEAFKTDIPRDAKQIAIISSPTGAAIRDVISVFKRRSPSTDLTIVPAAVQGNDAPSALLQALSKALELDPDAILLTRGGGSIEDLWAFNNEHLVRAIASCPIPVVSAVGHETDFTLCDFAADVRAPTPSAGAELLSNDQAEQANKLSRLNRTLSLLIESKLERARLRLERSQRRLPPIDAPLREYAQTVDRLESRLHRAEFLARENRSKRLTRLNEKLRATNPQLKLAALNQRLQKARQKLTHEGRVMLHQPISRLELASRQLNAVSPLATLDRGYALALDGNGAVLSDAADIVVDDTLTIKLRDGEISTLVKAIKIDKNHK